MVQILTKLRDNKEQSDLNNMAKYIVKGYLEAVNPSKNDSVDDNTGAVTPKVAINEDLVEVQSLQTLQTEATVVHTRRDSLMGIETKE